MAEDILKPAGSTKASKPDAGGGVIRNVPVIGVVKNNVDPTRTGRIQVYISDLGSDDPNNSSGWQTVSFLPPFYGFVQPTAPETGSGDYVANPASYGMWFSPPDLETEVICIFVNGDPNYGFYIGAVPKAEAMHMVPAIAGSENVITNNNTEATNYAGATVLPVTNINTNNEQTSNDNNFLDLAKPIHSYQAAIFYKQGLIRDTIRGPITSGANRESPSRVGWGVSTPGRPIYAGGYTDATVAQAALSGRNNAGLQVISRVGGHSIVMDDGDLIGRNNLVRIRSAAGHQITMSDDGQTIFITHSNGQSYIELGKEGTVDIFSTNSFNVRTQGDLNLHADNEINIHAKKKLNIKSENINIFSEQNTTHRTGGNYSIDTSGKYGLKVAGIMSLSSGDIGSFASGGTCFINGSQINLNTGSGPAPDAVDPLVDKLATDTLFTTPKGYTAAPGTLPTITTRTPAHAPWANANQGVNVDVNITAEDNLPSAPSSAASSAIATASATPVSNPVTPAALSTVPNVPPVSEGLDAPTTGAIVSATSVNAATGPAAAAVAAGAGVVPTTAGPVAAIGKFAQTPQQLAAAGTLKPGSAALVDSLIKSGAPLNSALPPNLFTGKNATSLGGFIGNQSSQISSLVSNFQQAQTALTGAGLLTGKEDPTVLAGFVMAGTTAGVGNTLNTVLQSANRISVPAAGIPGITNSVTNAINSGKSAAGLSQTSTGGLSSLFTAITSVGVATALSKGNNAGITSLALDVITNSIAPLPAGRPINLGSIGRDNMALAQARSNAPANSPFGQVTDLLKLAGRLGGPRVNTITNAVRGGLTSVEKLINARNAAETIGGVTGVIGSVGSIARATGNRSVSNSARQLNTVVNATTQISRAIVGITNASTVQQQLGGLGRIAGTLGMVGSVFGNKSLTRNTRKIGELSRSTSNILGAVDRILTSRNVNQTLGGVGSIIRSANRIRGVLGNSQRSSGISMLPGGNLSVGAVVNKSLGALGIPRNPALTSIITNAATSAINNILYPKSVQGARLSGSAIAGGLSNLGSGSFNNLQGPGALLSNIVAPSGLPGLGVNSISNIQVPGGLPNLGTNAITNAFTNVQNDIVNTLTNLQDSAGGLAKLALSNLPAGEADALVAAAGSVGFGGAGALELPTIGENTFDDGSVESELGSLLEDPRIPDIDYGSEPDPGGLAALESAIEINNQVETQLVALSQLQEQINQAREEYFAVESSALPGDPMIDEYRTNWIDLQNQADQLLAKIDQTINT